MTKLLKQAFEEASKLPELEQNAFARWLMEEILSEKKWEKKFAESEPILEELAHEAIEEYAKGTTKPLDVNKK